MDISYTLIVALMFITILSFGFANILSSIAEIVNKQNNISVSLVHLSWILLLLIIHFNLAWQAVLISTYKAWSYDAFLFVELGPILAFFTTRILAPSVSESIDGETLKSKYLHLSPRFFLIIALIQLWAVGIDLFIGLGFTGSAVFNTALFIMAITLMKIKNYQGHIYGAVIAWALYLAAIVLRGINMIS
jgi:hypothetical protein